MDKVIGEVQYKNPFSQLGEGEWRKDGENRMNSSKGHSQEKDSNPS